MFEDEVCNTEQEHSGMPEHRRPLHCAALSQDTGLKTNSSHFIGSQASLIMKNLDQVLDFYIKI